MEHLQKIHLPPGFKWFLDNSSCPNIIHIPSNKIIACFTTNNTIQVEQKWKALESFLIKTQFQIR